MYQSQRREFQFPESLKESLVKEFDYYGGIIERLSTDKTISYRISKNGECWRVIFLTPTIPREIVERLPELVQEKDNQG